MGISGEKEDVFQRIRGVVSTLSSLRIAYVYGSFLSRDDFRDIDIALLLDEQTSRDSFDRYAADAGDRIEEALGFRYGCDVRILNELPVWLGFEVIRTGIPLFVQNEEDRIDFETKMTVEYLDIRSLYDLFDHEYLAQV
jgi:hypothetical protein